MKEENEVEYEWKVFLETIKDSISDEFENVYVSNVNPKKLWHSDLKKIWMELWRFKLSELKRALKEDYLDDNWYKFKNANALKEGICTCCNQ